MFNKQYAPKIGALSALFAISLLPAPYALAPRALAAPATTKPTKPAPTVVETAFDFAENPNPFKYTVATVTMTALGKTTGLPKVLIGRGRVRMEGDLLQGKLDLTFDDSSKAKPGKNQLLFNVSRGNRIGLQWLIDDAPLNYASLKAFDATATADALNAKINWNGADWLLTATLENRIVRPDPNRKPGGYTFPVPSKKDDKGKKPPVIITTPVVIKPAKKAVGRNFIVTGRFLVTNSEDGIGGIFGNADNSVEMDGYVSIGNSRVLSLDNKSAQAGNSFDLKRLTVGMRYDYPNFHYCPVSGSITDFDKTSAPDMMWNASQSIDLTQIMESKREFIIKGDRKSESGDLYIRVTDGGEIME